MGRLPKHTLARSQETGGGRQGGFKTKQNKRNQPETKQKKPTQKVLTESGELGDLGTPMPPPRSSNQWCFLLVILFSKNDIPQKKSS